MRVLIAEDEKDLNKILTDRLKAENYSVDSCYDGQEALDYLASAEYDAVILDIMMPLLDGLSVLRTMRRKNDSTPVLLLTAKDSIDIKDFSAQVVTPALSAIAQAIDMDLLAVGVDKAGKTATVSSTPKLEDIAGVGKALDMSKAPLQNRRLVLPAEIRYKYNTLDNFAKQCYAGDSKALRDAEIGKVYTCETYASENCPHSAATTPGTVTAYKVAGTKDTQQFTVTNGTPTTGKIAAGDQLIVGGYLYTVTEDLALTSGGGTLKVDQNLPADIEATDAKVISKAHALGFHRNGIALVTRQLELPMGASKAYIASANGLAVRVVMDYDSKSKTDSISFDIIYGIKELDTNLLVDFS